MKAVTHHAPNRAGSESLFFRNRPSRQKAEIHRDKEGAGYDNLLCRKTCKTDKAETCRKDRQKPENNQENPKCFRPGTDALFTVSLNGFQQRDDQYRNADYYG
ncbi:hypothetical protein D9M70_631730 [compost metagenome]